MAFDFSKGTPVKTQGSAGGFAAKFAQGTPVKSSNALSNISVNKPKPDPNAFLGTSVSQNKIFGSSALGGFASGVTDSVVGTANNIAGPVKSGFGSLVDFLTGGSTHLKTEAQNESSAVGSGFTPKTTAEQVGNVVGQTAQFLAPVGGEEKAIVTASEYLPKAGEFLADEAGNLTKYGKAAAYGLRSLVRGTSAGVVAGVQSGSAKVGVEVGTATALTNPLLEKTGALLSGIYKHAMNFISGKPAEVVDAIWNSPEAGLKGVKDKTNVGIRDTVKTIQKYAADTYKSAVNKWGEDLKGIETKYSGAGNNVAYDLGQVKNIFSKNLSDFGISMKGEFGKGIDISNASTQTLGRVMSNAYRTVRDWTDNTPSGINTLASRLRTLGEKTKDEAAGSALNEIAGNMEKLLDNVPEVKSMRTDYAKTMQFLDDVNNYFKTGIKSDIKAGMNDEKVIEKVGTELATIFNDNKEVARQWIEGLVPGKAGIPGGKDMIAQQAGRIMSRGRSAGLPGSGGIYDRFTEAFTSKAAGWLTAKGAQLSQALSKMSTPEQAMFRELFTLAFGKGGSMPQLPSTQGNTMPQAGALSPISTGQSPANMPPQSMQQ